MAKMFTTPTDIPEGVACRTLKIPNNGIWLGIFNAALLETVNQYNWEQTYPEDMSIEDTVAACQAIIEDYWMSLGCGCMLPEIDTPPFRLGEDGHFQMLSPITGEWGTPTGEYEIPPTPARTEPTAYERRCLAAANAANVMEQLYEAITDEIALGGDTLQVAAAMVAALVTAVGGWIAAPVYAIIQLSIALFAGMIELLQVLGGDVWTEEFDERLKCALFACATDSGDVVTFDLTCIREGIAVAPDIFDPETFYDLQLFAQVLFLMETITMDGLNAAGATTAIETADCGCGFWCHEFDFTEGTQEWSVPTFYAGLAEYVSGQGFKPSSGGISAVGYVFPFPAFITSIGIDWSTELTGNYHRLFYKWDGAIADGGSTEIDVGSIVTVWGFDVGEEHASVQFLLQNGTPNVDYPLDYAITRVVINGTGDNPFETSNCEP